MTLAFFRRSFTGPKEVRAPERPSEWAGQPFNSPLLKQAEELFLLSLLLIT